MSGVNIHVPLEFRTRVLHRGSKKGRNIGPAVIGVNSPGEAGSGGHIGGYQMWFPRPLPGYSGGPDLPSQANRTTLWSAADF